MLSIPDDLRAVAAHRCFDLEEAVVVQYAARQDVPPSHVLVTRPTLVFVHAGRKQLQAHGSHAQVTAEAGAIVAMRAGTHLMAELVDRRTVYRSTIVCLDRTLLRWTLDGQVPDDDAERAATTEASTELGALIEALHEDLGRGVLGADAMRTVRALVSEAARDPAIGRTLRKDVVDWSDAPADRIRCVMAAHLLSPLGIAEYSKLCAMSVSSFKRHFRDAYHEAPGRWLAAARLHHAHTLLLAGNQPVTEVCAASGYQDLTNFIRAFRRRYGSPPAAYRRDHRLRSGSSSAS